MTDDQCVSDHVLTVGGARVAARLYRRPGPVQGRILFVNGAITTATALKWAVRHLGEFEVVVFDFPNVGQSRDLNAGLPLVEVETEGAIVSELISMFEPDYLISMSWGGTAALTALASRPPSVRRAIISSYSYGMTPALRRYGEVITAAVARGDREFAATHAIEELGEHLNARLRRHFRDYFLELDPEQDRYIVDHIRYVATLKTEAHVAQLAHIDIPVLFANGALDRFTPAESVRPFAAIIPDISFQVIPGAGHFLGNESREALGHVCAGIRDFWAPELAPPLAIAV